VDELVARAKGAGGQGLAWHPGPLARGLAPYDAWASGIRRDEAVTRTAIRVVLEGLDDPDAADALRGSALSRLVGRDEEIDLLLRRWARAKTGDGQIVLVSGEAGLGKSRIAAALAERLQA